MHDFHIDNPGGFVDYLVKLRLHPTDPSVLRLVGFDGRISRARAMAEANRRHPGKEIRHKQVDRDPYAHDGTDVPGYHTERP